MPLGENENIDIQTLAKLAESDGVHAFMATPPAAYPATFDEIYNYYRSILEATKVPLVVQDASNYIGQPLPLELYARLLNEFGSERVFFKPEATPVKERMQEIQEIHAAIAELIKFETSLDAYVAVEKYLLLKQGIFTSTKQRGPVQVKLDAGALKAIDLAFDNLKATVNKEN